MYLGAQSAVALLPMIIVVLVAKQFGLRSVALGAATFWFIGVELASLSHMRHFSYFWAMAYQFVFVGIVAYLATLALLVVQRWEGYRLTR